MRSYILRRVGETEVWRRAQARAQADGHRSMRQVIMALLRAYGDRQVTVTVEEDSDARGS